LLRPVAVSILPGLPSAQRLRSWSEAKLLSKQASPLTVIACDPPAFSEADACRIAADYYGLTVEAKPLVSERDQNFRLQTAAGERFVLKIANAAEDPQATDFQVQALLHVQRQPPADLPLPAVVPTRDGRSLFTLHDNGQSHVTRLVTYLDGTPLDDVPLTAPLSRNLGIGLAELGLALAGFTHAGAASQSLLWDMRQAAALREILEHIGDRDMRALVAACIDDFEERALPVYADLRSQVVHNDLNPANVLVESARPDHLAGIIDFGDMVYAPLAVDIAIGAAYLRELERNPLTWVAEFVGGYHSIKPLTRQEIDLLYDLVNTRLAATVAILHWRAAQRGTEDRYLQESAAGEADAARFLLRLRELPRSHVQNVLRQVCASVTELAPPAAANDQPLL